MITAILLSLAQSAAAPTEAAPIEWESRPPPQAPIQGMLAGVGAACSVGYEVNASGATQTTCLECIVVDSSGAVRHRRARRAYESSVRTAVDQWRAEPGEPGRSGSLRMVFTVQPDPGGPIVPAEGSPGAELYNDSCMPTPNIDGANQETAPSSEPQNNQP